MSRRPLLGRVHGTATPGGFVGPDAVGGGPRTSQVPLPGAPRPAAKNAHATPVAADDVALWLEQPGGLDDTAGPAVAANDEADAPPEVVADVFGAASPGLQDALAQHGSTPVAQPTPAQPGPAEPQGAGAGVETAPEFRDKHDVPRLKAINRNTFMSHFGTGVLGIVREAVDAETEQHLVTPMVEQQLRLENEAEAPALVGGRRCNLGRAWTMWPGRRTYPAGIGLWPEGDAPSGAYNLYKGFAVEPKNGDPAPAVEHIAYMCGGDTPLTEWVLDWMAFKVQRPGTRPETALVIRGGQGTGKGTLARMLLRIFGGHGLHLSQPKHLTGAFNAHLRYALFVVADEGWYAAKESEGNLKMLITEPTLVLEGKHKDAKGNVPNRVAVMILSNHQTVISAGVDERRFCVIDAPSEKAQDQKYFGRLHEWLDAGGDGIFLHYLLNRDLSAFNPRVVPKTAALDSQKIAAMSTLDRWLLDALDSGVVPGRHPSATEWGEDGAELRCDEAVDALKERGAGLRGRSAAQDARDIGKRLQEVFGCGPAAQRAGAVPAGGGKRHVWRAWHLPGLSQARDRAAKAFGLTHYVWGRT